MAERNDKTADSGQIIEELSRQVSDLKNRLNSATLEMEMMRARMNDLSHDAKKAANLERFIIPDEDRMMEINDVVSLMEKAIMKERKSRKARSDENSEAYMASPQKIDERQILIVLKLRRKGCYIREIASHTGLAVGSVHNIISKYSSDPQVQMLVTEGTQMELTDYFLIHTEE